MCMKARFLREKSLVSSAGRGCSESEGCPGRWCESTSLTYHRAGNRLLYSFKNRGQFSVSWFLSRSQDAVGIIQRQEV